MSKGDTSITYPEQIESVANTREHHMTKAKRTARQRDRASFEVRLHRRTGGWIPALDEGRGAVVQLVRIRPSAGRALDDDNLANAFKATRDGVARELGVDDRDARVSWRYAEEKGDAWQVRIEFHDRLAWLSRETQRALVELGYEEMATELRRKSGGVL